MAVATWTEDASSWVELQWNRIREIHPTLENDGVFLTRDQVWPQFSMVQIGPVDHAEPSVGSKNVDDSAFWIGMLKRFSKLVDDSATSYSASEINA